jgi:DNA-binding LytR/AlgR family response regulator
MPAYRAVIADDERLMREQLRARLAEVWPDLDIVAEARNGPEAIEAVRTHAPDLAFLDIRMPGMTGIEAAREILRLDRDADDFAPEVVFITAYDQHAVEAFEQGAADYVLKPAERERLARTVQRLQARLAAREALRTGSLTPGGASLAAPPASEAGSPPSPVMLEQLLRSLASAGTVAAAPTRPAPLRWIQAAVGATVQLIPVDDVLFFISDEKYTRVQTATTEALIRKPIKELLEELDPEVFWQIHRSTVVNVRAIAGVTRDLRGRQIVSVKGHPQKLEVSRSFSGLFKGM